MSDMRYRVLGSSGMRVSEICLGTMMFGGPTDPAEARRIIDHALDSGINFIDTADVYAQGRSESVIGSALTSTRARWVLATAPKEALPLLNADFRGAETDDSFRLTCPGFPGSRGIALRLVSLFFRSSPRCSRLATCRPARDTLPLPGMSGRDFPDFPLPLTQRPCPPAAPSGYHLNWVGRKNR